MDGKRLVGGLVRVTIRSLLVCGVGCVVGILLDADHLLHRLCPAFFDVFGAGARALHIPLLLVWLYAWGIAVTCYAGLGIGVYIQMNKEKVQKVVEVSGIVFLVLYVFVGGVLRALEIGVIIWAWPLIKLVIGW